MVTVLASVGLTKKRFGHLVILMIFSSRSPSKQFVGSMEAPSKAFLLFFLLSDWLKLNHLKSRMECGSSYIFSRHICSTVAETIGVTNYAASFGAKNVQKTTFEAAEMMLGPWNQHNRTPLPKGDGTLMYSKASHLPTAMGE